MDFDEYEYLEKTVENPEALKESNGDGRADERENGRDRSRSSKRRSDDDGHGHDHRSKRTRAEEEERERGERERGERDRGDRDRVERDRGDRDRSRKGRSPDHRARDRERGVEKERLRPERGERERDRGERVERVERVEKDRERGERGERIERAERVERGERVERVERGEKDRERERGERDRERNERNERDKDRTQDKDRERDKERDRTRGSRDGDRHREKDREREKEKEKEKEKEREREKEKEKEKEAQKEKERDKERESHRERDREREHRRSREGKDRKEEAAATEPEADPERDQRTVFAYQICLKADERDVYEFFSRAGKVRDVRLIMDRNSRRSKGVGYIEFYDAMSVPMAIALSGQPLLGQPVMVKPSEAEKNLVPSTTAVAGGANYIGPYSGGARRLYVGNLHFNMTEDQLRQVFEPFGPVELVQLPTDPETGQCKGFGFVQYARLEDARAAQQNLNGVLELAGRAIKVSAVSDQLGMQDMGVNPGELDDDEGGGLSLNARSRALLMQKLDRSGTATSAGGIGSGVGTAPALGLLGATVGLPGVAPSVAPLVPSPLAGLPGIGLAGFQSPGMAAAGLATPMSEPIGVPSEFLLLKNMFDPNTETEPDFDMDIKEDVQEECSKFGEVKHIYVDKNSPGHVYLRFNSTSAAMSAQVQLHGRWFAGKMITATFMTALAYETKFPDSK